MLSFRLNNMWSLIPFVTFTSSLFAANTSFPPNEPTDFQCQMQCWQYNENNPSATVLLDEKVQEILVCAKFASDLQPIADRYCADQYAAQTPPGWITKARFGTPLAPGSLISCTAKGRSCAKPEVHAAMWQCPAVCKKIGFRDLPTTFNYCGLNAKSALDGGINFYATTGSHPLCQAGYELAPFTDPEAADVVCTTTVTACAN